MFEIFQKVHSTLLYPKLLIRIQKCFQRRAKNFEGLTPARLMTSTGITVSISSAPLARMTRALFEAIFMLYLLKTQLKQDFQETFTASVEDLKTRLRNTVKQSNQVLPREKILIGKHNKTALFG